MIIKVSHQIADHGPAALALALTVTRDLHVPIPAPRKPQSAPRAPEVVTRFPELMGLRTGPVRTHRRKVPLNRLTAVRA